MNSGFQYGNNPDGYTQQEIDQGEALYDEVVVRDALWGCAIGAWSRRECSFGDGDGANADLFEEAGIQSEHTGFEITMPDGSRYRVTVQQTQGPRWEQQQAAQLPNQTGVDVE